jgi:hypothetical protein
LHKLIGTECASIRLWGATGETNAYIFRPSGRSRLVDKDGLGILFFKSLRACEDFIVGSQPAAPGETSQDERQPPVKQAEQDEGEHYLYAFFECHPDGACKVIGRPFRSTAAECAKAIMTIPPRGVTTFECARKRVDQWETVH